MIESGGVLLRGIEGVKDGVTLQNSMEEIDYTLPTRFVATAKDLFDLRERCKRKSKAEKTLELLHTQCNKLKANKDTDAKAREHYLAQIQRRDDHEVKCRLLRAQFEDFFHGFMTRFSALLSEDMKGLTEKLHMLLSSLSYQIRNCKDNLSSNPAAFKTRDWMA
ncbi:hypothetical protein JKF63_05157 [Porcisia hertigi]|uniref:Uncharacterized protein n=1 Tax=Porcisia hertigi TaxID=2761500 RepID=A0A836LB71_9TRYP|nr:hypothetical protein JKF63_05157 [Porcisia hertigi]